MMTLKVYRVRPDGSQVVIRKKRPVRGKPTPSVTTQWPPCACPRCRLRKTER